MHLELKVKDEVFNAETETGENFQEKNVGLFFQLLKESIFYSVKCAQMISQKIFWFYWCNCKPNP